MSGVAVAGLDLSLTSTGVAVVELGAGPAVWRTRTVASKGRKDATLAERSARLRRIQHEVIQEVLHADLVVVEGPSFGQARQGGQHDRAGFWWLTVDELDSIGVPVVEVSPASRSKYATGKGNASKDVVLAAVVKRYLEVDVTGNDVADAVVLASMGARHLGLPLEKSLPLAHLSAMDGVTWPPLVQDVPLAGVLL